MGNGGGGDNLHYPKNWLVPPHVPPALLSLQNADFVIFMQFLAILPKLSPTSRPHLGNPDDSHHNLEKLQFHLLTTFEKLEQSSII